MVQLIGSYGDANLRMTAEINFSLLDWSKFFEPENQASLMKLVSNEIIGGIQKRFDTGYGAGRRWPKKKPDTIWYEGGARNTMIFTGRLRDSFQYIYTAGEIIVYTRIPYAGIHNFGCTFMTTQKQATWLWANVFDKQGVNPMRPFKVSIPQREFMYFTDAQLTKIKKLIYDFVKQSERLGK